MPQFRQLEHYLDLFKAEYNQKIIQHQEAYVILETLYNNYQEALNMSRVREEKRIENLVESRVRHYLGAFDSNTLQGVLENDYENALHGGLHGIGGVDSAGGGIGGVGSVGSDGLGGVGGWTFREV